MPLAYKSSSLGIVDSGESYTNAEFDVDGEVLKIRPDFLLHRFAPCIASKVDVCLDRLRLFALKRRLHDQLGKLGTSWQKAQ